MSVDFEAALLSMPDRDFRCLEMVPFALSRVLARISALPPAFLDGEPEWNIDDKSESTCGVFLVVEKGDSGACWLDVVLVSATGDWS